MPSADSKTIDVFDCSTVRLFAGEYSRLHHPRLDTSRDTAFGAPPANPEPIAVELTLIGNEFEQRAGIRGIVRCVICEQAIERVDTCAAITQGLSAERERHLIGGRLSCCVIKQKEGGNDDARGANQEIASYRSARDREASLDWRTSAGATSRRQ